MRKTDILKDWSHRHKVKSAHPIGISYTNASYTCPMGFFAGCYVSWERHIARHKEKGTLTPARRIVVCNSRPHLTLLVPHSGYETVPVLLL